MEDLRFTNDHDWVKADNKTAYIGISDYAQSSLGDIVYVEIPEIGKVLAAGKAFMSVESVKAVADIKSPISGKVIEVNEALADEPQLLNEAPYDNWLVLVELSETSEKELDALMDEKQYEDFCGKEG